MKLAKQIAVLVLVAGLFVLFDLMIFHTFTKRCLPDSSAGRSAKTIDLSKYLPFDADSQIVKVDSDSRLSGEIPVMDGAEGLYPIFSSFVNAVYPENSVKFDGEKFAPDSKLQMNNTLRAYEAVVDGRSDVILCAAPSDEQRQYAEDSGVELEYVPIGREAFVFLVNKENPVDGLSVQEIRDIYKGNHTNWKELGGNDMPVHPMQRIDGSGSQTALLSFMGGREIKKNYLGFLGSPIGFSFRYYTQDVVKHGNIKMLSLDGVYPSIENIKNGSYPVVFEFYAVYDKKNDNPNVRRIVDWMLSDEAQEIVAGTGYAPIR